jgi:mannose-1-phosphate guanylyltransferase
MSARFARITGARIMEHLHAVIMAGGRGERFWPLSTDALPKPFVPLLGSRTLIQETVSRLETLVPPERILISIGKPQESVAREQLPGIPAENFIVEPVGRDTAACLGYCALHLERRDPSAVMLAVPADHFIGDVQAYRRSLRAGFEDLAGATGVVYGIPPTRPETGYGYVLAEKPPLPSRAWPVLRFVEKPDASRAEEYVRSGRYFWNSGIFLWRNRALLELFERLMPATWRGMVSLRKLIGRPDLSAELHRVFAELPRISVDYGILEKTVGLRLVPAEFGWDDIGTWSALARALPADTGGNVARGRHSAVDSSGCIVYSDSGGVATFGVKDLVIVQANGQVLVCPKDRASELKKLVEALREGATTQ